MKLNKEAVELQLARKCWTILELATNSEISPNVYQNGIKGNIAPKQAGKIAKALGVDVETIIAKEGEGLS